MVIPLILLMFMGTVDVGRLLFAYIALEEAVQEGATYGSHVPEDPVAIEGRVTSSSDHGEVTNANVTQVLCTPEDTTTTPPTPGTVTVTAVSNVPSVTPVGSVLFGGSFQLQATVVATNLEPDCIP